MQAYGVRFGLRSNKPEGLELLREILPLGAKAARWRAHPLVALVAIRAGDDGDEIGRAAQQRRIDRMRQRLNKFKNSWWI